jgi:hypothetical protein
VACDNIAFVPWPTLIRIPCPAAPSLLLCRVLQNRPGSGPVFARQHIAACMAKVQLMDLQETLQVRCYL